MENIDGAVAIGKEDQMRRRLIGGGIDAFPNRQAIDNCERLQIKYRHFVGLSTGDESTIELRHQGDAMNAASVSNLTNQLSLVCIHDVHLGSMRDKESPIG